MKNILFICTGNYYRSRFAEEYFNHLAVQKQLPWQAHSKGLSENMPSLNNPGPISMHTLEAMKERGLTGKNLERYPRPLRREDFAKADRVIAMSEIEHKPMIKGRFLAQAGMVEYFEVGDLPLETPEMAIGKIANLVDKLVVKIKRAEKKDSLLSA